MTLLGLWQQRNVLYMCTVLFKKVSPLKCLPDVVPQAEASSKLSGSAVLGKVCPREKKGVSASLDSSSQKGNSSQGRTSRGDGKAMSAGAERRRMDTLSKGLTQQEINYCEVPKGQAQRGVPV